MTQNKQIYQLLDSKRYQEWCAGFDVLAMGRAGPIDHESWTDEQWRDVLSWACAGLELPTELAEYRRKVEAA